MEKRKIEEQEFHDRLRSDSFGQRWDPALEAEIKKNPLWTNMKYYAIERRSREFVLGWLQAQCQNKTVLDYCCGNGEDALFVAKNGASSVTGIDISTVSIENCKKRAKDEQLNHIVSFHVMDAEHLTFADNSFDVVTEYGCLHHLHVEKAFEEIARVLTTGGKAICNEALGHNPFIHLYRKMTPHLRTKYETAHILKKKEITLAKKYFEHVDCYFFHLATLTAVPFRNLTGFDVLLSVMEYFDSLFLNVPFVKWWAWQIVFICSNPIKKEA